MKYNTVSSYIQGSILKRADAAEEGHALMAAKVTIKEIAKHAGVGTTTVSRVLNDHPYVSDDKRERVERAIAALDYHPSQTARHLRGSPSGLLGFLTDDVATTPYAVDIIRGAQDVAWAHRMVLLVADTGGDARFAEAAADVFRERAVEGIVYAAMYHRPVELPRGLAGLPTVLANCFLEDRSAPSVVPDETYGGYHATAAAIAAGHRRIGFINLWEADEAVTPPFPAIYGRLRGYQRALADHGLDYDETLLRFSIQTPRENYRHTQELLALDQPPTAIFCGNDKVAMNCYSALAELGLSVPGDVAVIGFDNIAHIAEGLLPALTTMQLPHYAMGKWAVQYLMDNRGRQLEPLQMALPCPLVARESV